MLSVGRQWKMCLWKVQNIPLRDKIIEMEVACGISG